MKSFRWTSFAAVAVFGLLAAATAQYVNGANEPAAQDLPLPADSPGLARAYELSDAFREVSRRALPALVSIRTKGNVVRQVADQQDSPFNDDFFRHFGNDPRLRQFFDRKQNREFRRPDGQGSGFIIDADGIVMTNSHVVANAEEIIVRLADGREFQAIDMKHDKRSDVAVLKLEVGEKLPYLPLGDDNNIEIGDWVLAFGSPFGLHRSVTQGIISAKGRGLSPKMTQEFLQTDAAVNPGNSGGPLVNLRGEVVGINTAISSRSGGYDGVSLAVPVNLAKWVSEQLLADGVVHRAYIGITMQPISADLAKAFDLRTPNGVVVTSVVNGSPAANAGFQQGDVIVKVNGQKITTNRNMLSVVEKLSIGQSYTVQVLRDGQERDLNVIAAERPRDIEKLVESNEEAIPEMESEDYARINSIGISVQNLTDDLANSLNVTTGNGVVITEVKRGSPAVRAGLKPGMVIVSVGNRPIANTTEFVKTLKNEGERDQVLLLVKNLYGSANAPGFIRVPMGDDDAN